MRKKTCYRAYYSRGVGNHLNRHYNYLWDKLKFEEYEYIVHIRNGLPDIKKIKELRDKVRR